jgi:hypothetical protein
MLDSRRYRAELSAPTATAKERLGLGDRTAALGREVLDPVPRLDYNPDVLSLHLDCGAVVAATRLAKMLTLASQTDEPW